MTKVFITFMAVLSLSISALANETSKTTPKEQENWTEADYWKDADINFNRFVSRNIHNQICSAKPQFLIACMDSLATGLQLVSEDGFKLVKYQPGIAKEKSEFHPFVVETYEFKDYLKYQDDKKEYYVRLNKQLAFSSLKAVNVFPLLKKIVDSIEPETKSLVAAEMFNSLMAVGVDPHTYITPTKMFERQSQGSVKRKGVGIYLEIVEKGILITDVIDGSPAKAAGLLAGDIITTINGKSKNLTKEVIDEVDSKLDLVILREGESFDLSFEKDFYTITNVIVRVEKFKAENYLYVKLGHFMDPQLCNQIQQKAEAKMAKNKIDGLILDLRNNGGGRVDLAQCLMGLFLEPGSISWSNEYLTQAPGTLIVDYHKGNDNIFGDMHTVTLVNPRSASASEATAMFLKEYRKTFVVGERSFGKGTMQRISGDMLNSKILHGSTVAKYYGPKGISPQIIGVTPDFEVFPKKGQETATDARREEDLFVFPIANSLPKNYNDIDRKEDLALVNDCMIKDNTEENQFKTLSGFSKRFYDNQLAKAKEVLKCANENVDIYKSIDLDNLSGMKIVSNQVE